MSDGLGPSSEIPVAEPTDEVSRRDRSDPRRQLAIVLVVVVCLAAAAIPVTIRLRSDDHTRPTRATKRFVDPKQARIEVGAALAATIAARNYRITSVLSETAPAGSVARGPTFSSVATVNVAPLAMVATSDIAGHITSWTDGTRQWELGGGNYGLTSPAGIGPGQPISGFTPLVVGTLGQREGGVAMMGLSSPNGHLDLTAQSITSAAPVGTSTIAGDSIKEYVVHVNASELVHQPGMTAEQVKTAADGFQLLDQEGYTGTTERVGIDEAGYLRESHTVWNFADGGTVVADTTFSDYGCAGTVVLPTQTPQAPPAATCTSPDPAATTPPTSAASASEPSTEVLAPAPPALVPDTTSATVVFRDADAAITYAYGHFFDPALTSDERAALIQGSAGMRDFIDSSFTRHEGEAAAGAVIADHITVNGATADVSFHALYGGHESPANPGQLSGTAVLEDGAWKISRATFCMLSAGDGEVCPPAS